MRRFTFALVLSAVSAPLSAGEPEEKWEKLEAGLRPLFDKAVVTKKGAALVGDMRGNLELVLARHAELKRLGAVERITVRFDAAGDAVAKVTAGGVQGLVVAVQVHQNRMAHWESMIALEHYVVNAVWEGMGDEQKRAIEDWARLPVVDRKKVGKADTIVKLAARDTLNSIAELSAKIKRDPANVDLLIRRGRLYAKLGGGYSYPAWVDLARAVILDPKHKDARETSALASAQLEAASR